MLIIGLTGSIGMGKTTVANHIAARGVPVIDSDGIVHRLYEGEAVPHIESAFPGTTVGGKVDRARLAAAAMQMPDAFARLEALVHPLVRLAQWRFIQDCAAAGEPICVLDIPLLFETGGDRIVDASMVVSAPEQVQTERVMARPGMTPEKLAAIRAQQMSDAEKRARADYLVDTGLPLDETIAQVDKILESLKHRAGDKIDLWRRLHTESAGDGDLGG
ncbi:MULTISPECIES: dephospho-CoA kinase [Rhodomicrobium]|uniref:dephospho-CoA kinase n=1 Tax=Rhodomicrobium TaxID=1068 RepID=UPI000B4B57DF|nr:MULTISPECIES: dephospho-CoA kinase [Rhodomicrobium]